ncbi:MAG TPA: DinB family protein [Candidatus Dormibacteraeota bacterium]|nr:DinB family protein [Candidatus Dormibacteraeota bacterium]
MTPEEARALFQYNEWANQRSLDATAQLSNEQFVQPLGSSFSSVRDTLMHVCGAEWIWFERFHGRSHPGIPDFSNIQSIGVLREHWAPQAKALLDFVYGLSQAELDRVFEYKTLNFGMYANPLWQSLQHVANHGTYHRGQIATMVRQHGAKPIATDLMHFYRESATAAKA